MIILEKCMIIGILSLMLILLSINEDDFFIRSYLGYMIIVIAFLANFIALVIIFTGKVRDCKKKRRKHTQHIKKIYP